MPKYSQAIIDDNLISNDLKNRLKAQIELLENIPEEKKDWHPGSNHQVLDLIHPSMYCFVDKLSLSKREPPVEEKKKRNWWDPEIIEPEGPRCQWLPAEFEVDYENESDPKVNINSYINNIDQVKQKELYSVIGEIFGKFHSQLKNNSELEGIGSNIGKTNKLQVIVKAANIIVTPEKPYYCGGTFHKEGMPYEHIAATGIYYYHSENVKKSYLEFRSEISEPFSYGQDNVKGCYDMVRSPQFLLFS